MKQSIKAPLLKTLAKATAQDPSRQGGVFCIPILDNPIDVVITLVFVANFTTTEVEFIEVTKPDKNGGSPICIGGVLTLPSFWLDHANKGLTPYYLENIIDEIYSSKGWPTEDEDDGTSGSSNHGCNGGGHGGNHHPPRPGGPLPNPNPIRAIGL